MIEYIKMIIIALVSGFAAPWPVSSSAQFSILSKAVFLTDDENKLGFYFALFGVTLSVVIFFCLRKIYLYHPAISKAIKCQKLSFTLAKSEKQLLPTAICQNPALITQNSKNQLSKIANSKNQISLMLLATQ